MADLARAASDEPPVWDGRHRVLTRTFPEGDAEQFAYDGLDNVLSLTEIAKPGSGLANTVVSAPR
jgi:YD repeat-containing protein